PSRWDDCLIADRHGFERQWRSIQERQRQGKPVDKAQARLDAAVARSREQVARRRAGVPVITYPDDLPIAQKRDAIIAALQHSQVVVVAGETGSGKTTQLPKICLELGRGVTGMIGHTQPRRIAARTVAQRIAEELNSPLGDKVGYQVRFTEQVGEGSHIKLMTDGILLAEIQHDRYLTRYDTPSDPPGKSSSPPPPSTWRAFPAISTTRPWWRCRAAPILWRCCTGPRRKPTRICTAPSSRRSTR